MPNAFGLEMRRYAEERHVLFMAKIIDRDANQVEGSQDAWLRTERCCWADDKGGGTLPGFEIGSDRGPAEPSIGESRCPASCTNLREMRKLLSYYADKVVRPLGQNKAQLYSLTHHSGLKGQPNAPLAHGERA